MKRSPLLVASLVCLAISSGCSLFEHTAEVESNTTWSGSFGGSGQSRTVDGSGNQDVKMKGDAPFCAVVQKQTRTGNLSVSINGHSESTSAEFGVVSVCD